MEAARSPGRPGDAAPPIIVGGCPRSGTTLLRVMLDSHPEIACGPELKIINMLAHDFVRMQKGFGPVLRESYDLGPEELAATFGDQIASILDRYRRRAGKRRVAEKTPQNIHVFPVVARMLPRSPLVHLIRDGRDVIVSLMKQRWIDPVSRKPMGYNTDIRLAARYWVKAVTDGRAVPTALRGDRYTEIRYEALVRKPEATMRTLLEFLGEPWDPAVLRHHEQPHDFAPSEQASHGDAQKQPVYQSAIGRWRDAWSAEDRAIVDEEAGALLRELGYVVG